MKFKDMKRFKCPYGFDYVTKSVMVGNNKVPCLSCGEPTEYVEVFSETHFCSEECVDKFYEQVNELEQQPYDEDIY